MNVKLQFNRALILSDALIKGFRRKQKNPLIGKKIGIVFQQIFGDAIVLQNSLNSYVRLFPQSQGYEILLFARPSAISFMNATLRLPTGIKFVEVDFERFLREYAYYKKIVTIYCDYINMLIIPGSSMSAEIFSAVNMAERKIALGNSTPIKHPLYRALLYNRAYTEIVVPDKQDMMLQRHRRLLNYLGDKEYKSALPELLPKNKVIMEEHYCVICPGSSKMEKCWPTERFCKIADYIIEHYHMNIHLCGGKDEVAFESILVNQIKHSEHVISHIGKTTFSNWSAIVQHADLVVGNDSATMHLAAASRRKAICIAGVYDKYQFFPYKVDIRKPEERLPVTLIKDMPCEWCRTIGYYAGFGNKQCAKRIKRNKCACCINEITVQEVIDQIDKIMLNES